MRYKPQKCPFCQIIPQNMSITIPLGVEPLTFVCLICLIFSSYVPTPPPLPRIPVNIVLYSYTTYPIILHIFCCTHHHASLSHLFCICINCPMHIFPYPLPSLSDVSHCTKYLPLPYLLYLASIDDFGIHHLLHFRPYWLSSSIFASASSISIILFL